MENMKFGKWAEIWLEEKRHLVKESTYANYTVAMANHILPTLGEQFLKDINRKIVQNMIFGLIENGRVDEPGGLSLKTVKDIGNILMMCLRDAQQDENYYNWKIIYPRGNDIENGVQIISVADISKMLTIIREKSSPECIGFAVSIYTGMRIGEVCALKWEDIDLSERCISVNKTLQRAYFKNMDGSGYSKVIIAAPKSKKSRRVIPIGEMLYELLQEMKREKSCYLITGTTRYMEPRAYRTCFKKFMRENGLPDVRFHTLRHTFATRCISNGTDYKTVSELLGHASVTLTMNLYVHSQMEEKRKCVETLGKLYG